MKLTANVSDSTTSNLNTINLLSNVFGLYAGTSKITTGKKARKCYSARTALKYNGNDITQAKSLSNKYDKCIHCGWYSHVFYKKTWNGVKIIENDEDYEKVKEQFVRHMNRSHPKICQKKIMMRLDNKEQLV